MGRPSPVVLALGGLIVVAFALRVEGALSQSIWLDEEFTRRVVDEDLKEMLREIAATESNSALFYGLEWLVTQVLGVGDRTLRVVPVLAGVLSVPFAYLLGRQLRDDVAGLILAALVAISPLAVWYGVEARSYSITLLLSLTTLVFFVRVLQAPRDQARWIALWIISGAALALAHYFGAFVLLAQLIWMLVARPALRPQVSLGIGALVVVGVAALPLWAIQDNGRTAYIAGLPFDHRLRDWAREVAIGMSPPDLPLEPFVWIGAAIAIAAAIYFTLNGDRNRREVLHLGGVGLIAIALSLTIGKDYMVGRNLIAIWPIAAALVAVGLASIPRKLAAIPALLVVIPMGIATTALITEPTLQRPDFKQLAGLVGPPRQGKVVVVSGKYRAFPLGFYLGVPPQAPEAAVPATEIVAVGSDRPEGARSCISGALCNLGDARPLDPPLEGEDLAGLKLVERRRVGYWLIATYRTDKPVGISEPVAGRIFENPFGPERFAHGPPP